MKRCSFEIAKAIKEAGYPQEWNDTEYYYNENGELKRCDDYEGNSIEDIMYNQRYAVPAPYVMEVWLWLFREKGIRIDAKNHFDDNGECCWTNGYIDVDYADPEEAIISAINFLVEQDLIK